MQTVGLIFKHRFTNKSPFRGETEGATEELGQLEFVNDVCDQLALVFKGAAITPNASAAD